MVFFLGHESVQIKRRWQSGQMQRTVNPPEYSYAGSNPARRTSTKISSSFCLGDFCSCAGRKTPSCLSSGFAPQEHFHFYSRYHSLKIRSKHGACSERPPGARHCEWPTKNVSVFMSRRRNKIPRFWVESSPYDK